MWICKFNIFGEQKQAWNRMNDISGLLFCNIIKETWRHHKLHYERFYLWRDWKLEAACFLLFPTWSNFHPSTQSAILSDSQPTLSVCLCTTKVNLSYYPLLTVNTWLLCAFGSYRRKLCIDHNCFLVFAFAELRKVPFCWCHHYM